MVEDICDLKKIDKFFDIAIVRGVLHHLDDISAGIANISSIAKEVVVLEPNAYNLMVRVVLKRSVRGSCRLTGAALAGHDDCPEVGPEVCCRHD